MAGTGPAPAAQKRRRNKENIEELPGEGYQGDFPALPKTYRLERIVLVKDKGSDKKVPELKLANIAYLKATREWYETWARSPMAVEFTGVHWQRLQRIARIVDQYEREADPKILAEIRLQEAGFGGTPLDLRRLGRKITPAVETPGRQHTARAKSTASRRARLSIVK